MAYNACPGANPDFNDQEHFNDAFYYHSQPSSSSYSSYPSYPSSSKHPETPPAMAFPHRSRLLDSRGSSSSPSPGNPRSPYAGGAWSRGAPSRVSPGMARSGSSSRSAHRSSSSVAHPPVPMPASASFEFTHGLPLGANNSVGMSSSQDFRDLPPYEASSLTVVMAPSPYYPRSPRLPAFDSTTLPSQAALSPPIAQPTSSHTPSYRGHQHKSRHSQDMGICPRDVFGVPPTSPTGFYEPSDALFCPPVPTDEIYHEDLFTQLSPYPDDGDAASLQHQYDGLSSPLSATYASRKGAYNIHPDSFPASPEALKREPSPPELPARTPKVRSPTPRRTRDGPSKPRKSLPASAPQPPSPSAASYIAIAPRPLPDGGSSKSSSSSSKHHHHRGTDSSSRRRSDAAAAGEADRAAQDSLLLEKRREGYSYKEIRKMGNFSEAESTLRGRYRALTKDKEQRVRVPTWTEDDLNLLNEAVRKFCKSKDPRTVKISWNKVAQYIVDNGGSYHFGNATCHKVWSKMNEGRDEEDDED